MYRLAGVSILLFFAAACRTQTCDFCAHGLLPVEGGEVSSTPILRREEVNGEMQTVLHVDRIEADQIESRDLDVTRLRVKSPGLRTSSEWTSRYSLETTIDLFGVHLVLTETGKRRLDGRKFEHKSGLGLSFFHGAPVIEMRRRKKTVTIAWEEDGIYQYVDGKPKELLMKVDW